MSVSPSSLPSDSAPLVSVVIAAWRAADYVGVAIRSALAQEDVSIEVIVVDDASPDDTAAYVQTAFAGDPRVRAVRLETNGGPAAARNRGFALAKGRFIAVLDADDTMEPGRLARLAALADAQDADLVVDNLKLVDPSGGESPNSPALQEDTFRAVREIKLSEYIDRNEMFASTTCIGYLKPVFRRSTLLDLQLTYDPNLRIAEDYYIVAHLLAAGGKMIFEPSAGYRYQIAPGSISHRLNSGHTAAILEAEDDFARRLHGASVAPALAHAQARRRRHLRNVDAFTRCVEALKAHKLFRALWMLATHPAGLAFTFGQFTRIAGEKLAKLAAHNAPTREIT